MAFLSAMMYTTSVHSESTKFQVHSITSSSLPQSSTGVGPYGSAAVRWSWAAVVSYDWYSAGARRRGGRCRGAPAPVRSPVRAGLPGCLPVSALPRSPAAQTRYTVPGRCSLLWRGTAGGGRAAGRDRSTQGQAGAAASCSLRLSRLPLGSGTGWRGRGAGSRRVRESVRFLRFVCGIELWIPGVDPNGGYGDPLLSCVCIFGAPRCLKTVLEP